MISYIPFYFELKGTKKGTITQTIPLGFFFGFFFLAMLCGIRAGIAVLQPGIEPGNSQNYPALNWSAQTVLGHYCPDFSLIEFLFVAVWFVLRFFYIYFICLSTAAGQYWQHFINKETETFQEELFLLLKS